MKKRKQTVTAAELSRVQEAIRAARDAMEAYTSNALLDAAAYELKFYQAKREYLLEAARRAAET